MKTINLRGITESLSEREMKLVKGGVKVEVPAEPPLAEGVDVSGSSGSGGGTTDSDCNKMKLGDLCTRGGNSGCCAAAPFAGYICKVPC